MTVPTTSDEHPVEEKKPLLIDEKGGSTALLRQTGNIPGIRRRIIVEKKEEDIVEEVEEKYDAWGEPQEVVMKLGSTFITLYRPNIKHVFERVQGRTAMAGNLTEYLITKDEVSRRANGPEHLSGSSLAINLRRLKNKDSSGYLRSELLDLGLLHSVTTRQGVSSSRIMPLCEAESIHFASDLNRHCTDYYPHEGIAEELINESKDDATVAAVTDHSEDLVKCVEALNEVLGSVIPPLTCVSSVFTDDVDLNESIERFSSFTHGLGIACNLVWIEQLNQIAKSVNLIEESKEHDIDSI